MEQFIPSCTYHVNFKVEELKGNCYVGVKFEDDHEIHIDNRGKLTKRMLDPHL
jgi:hypothetical protein